MTKIVKKITTSEESMYITYYQTLGFEITNREEKGEAKVVLTFVLDDENKDKAQKLLIKYPLKANLPMWPLFVLLGIIIALTTVFLVLCVTKQFESNMTAFAYFMIPAFILVLVASAYLIVRYFTQIANYKVLVNQIDDIKKEAKELDG